MCTKNGGLVFFARYNVVSLNCVVFYETGGRFSDSLLTSFADNCSLAHVRRLCISYVNM